MAGVEVRLLSQHLSPALSRLDDKDPASHCHGIIAASLFNKAKNGKLDFKTRGLKNKVRGKHRGASQ